MSLQENEDVMSTAPQHTRQVFDVEQFPVLVEWIIELAREHEYDALAACGHSGLLVAAAAAYILHIPVIAIRKPGDRAKGDRSDVNAVLPRERPLRYAIIDDFVSSGETVVHIVRRVREYHPNLVLAAILLHEQDTASWAGKILEWGRVEDLCAGAIIHARGDGHMHVIERRAAASPPSKPVSSWGLEELIHDFRKHVGSLSEPVLSKGMIE
jgi:adenine/guanine phosphoribosyltransferase-like PRPP-binding protein